MLRIGLLFEQIADIGLLNTAEAGMSRAQVWRVGKARAPHPHCIVVMNGLRNGTSPCAIVLRCRRLKGRAAAAQADKADGSDVR